MRRVRTAVLAAAITVGSVMTGTGTATAAHPVEKTYRADGWTAGPASRVYGRGFYQGIVNMPGNTMEIDACDLAADGMRVVVWVYNSSRSYKVQDVNGAGNACERLDDVPHLIVGTIKVCRQDGSAGTPRDCGYSSFDYSAYWEA
ncbi:hypothetical protein [Actinokineospora sp. UTMC 2448]|uniref:hypothetical protein n=1 Tax=Actinokineospora sp. UTMC 2448 TaxID=2268449 RepID=UPI00216464B2|nr:hypothetical protein [Actinokineospora sp. UTMC 2448]UVS78710.1 hypothetical protein Actkin_02446 [Actinokineospora sp. UTMC 2448]